MTDAVFPTNLINLYVQEQLLRKQALEIAQGSQKRLLHLQIIERSMSLAKAVIDCPDNEEDFRVIKMLSIRIFNSFASSLQLMLSGYHQNSGILLRDVLETLFLMDLFSTDYSAIERWRRADKKAKDKEFSPLAVRIALDARDAVDTCWRAETYKMFSELAAHPNMHSQHMLKLKNGDIMTGPFMEVSSLQAGISELAQLAVQIGMIMNSFLPKEYNPEEVRESFLKIKNEWIRTFSKDLSRSAKWYKADTGILLDTR